MGVHYQAKEDIYHWWNADACCLFSGGAGADNLSNVVTFTPAFGSFGFCECIGWQEDTGDVTCAGGATATAMICPVAASSGSMCTDRGALASRPTTCGSVSPTLAPPVGTTVPPVGTTVPPVGTTVPPTVPPATPEPPTCAPDWGS